MLPDAVQAPYPAYMLSGHPLCATINTIPSISLTAPALAAPCLFPGAYTNAPVAITKALATQFWPAVYQRDGRQDHCRSERHADPRRISLSGGDPLHPQNVPDILQLVQRIHAECPGKDIWVWTGYKLDELNAAQMQVVDLINVLVDGKFVQDLKDPALIWRGSSNRVVHHLR